MDELPLIVDKERCDFLTELNCCSRCILIYSGESNIQDIISNDYSVNSLRTEDEKFTVSTEDTSDPKTSNNSSGFIPKRRKTFTCYSCIGLLQDSIMAEAVQKIIYDLEEKGFDASIFTLGVSLPISIGLRIHSIWAHLFRKFPTTVNSEARRNHITLMKDVWKNIVGPQIEVATKKTLTLGVDAPLKLTVYFIYTDDTKECHVLEKLDEKKFSLRRKQHRKYNEGVFTKQVIEDTLEGFTDEQFLAACSDLPPVPSEPLSYSQTQCAHTSIYLAGRYNKYSRELPQTPWFVDEKRRFDSSVQELICDPLNQTIKADELKFSASGREDVDVRCLGDGRPFVIKFINPRRTKLTSNDVELLQKTVNGSTNLVAIKDLQMVLKKDTSNLKEGEEEKTKSYCALCFSPEIVTDKLLQKLDTIKDLTLDQMTPLRVLHRRPLSVRKRVVHTATTQTVNDHFFKLYLKTQAGTYIKEFIHGDFGRTIPNLGSMLGIKCDIIALDVENVQLDWPPPIG